MASVGRRKKLTRKTRAKISISQYWTDDLQAKFDLFKNILRQSSEKFLMNYDIDLPLVVLTDASDHFWSATLGQTKENKSYSNADELLAAKIMPMTFSAGRFTGPQLNWTVPEKEIYPILCVMNRFRFLTKSHPTPIILGTDHKNLYYLLNPGHETKSSSLSRLYRWVLKLQEFSLRVIHLPGEKNIFADLLSRWGYPGDRKAEAKLPAISMFPPKELNNSEVQVGEWVIPEGKLFLESKPTKFSPVLNLDILSDSCVLSEENHALEAEEWSRFINDRVSFLHPDYNGKWERVTSNELILQQQLLSNKENFNLDQDGIMRTRDGQIFIPKSLVGRILIHNHVHLGHTSVEEQINELKEYKLEGIDSVRRLREILMNYKKWCLHCEMYPYLVRRRLESIPHGRSPGEVLYTDYTKAGETDDGVNYILTLTDDFSRVVMLEPTDSPNSETLVKLLMRWKAHRGFKKDFLICSDQGSHFCSTMIQEMGRRFSFQNRFSVVYSPWANSGAETTNRNIWKYMRALLSQYRLDNWIDVLPLVEVFINNRRNPSRNNISPNELFCGRELGDREMIQPVINETDDLRIVQQASKKSQIPVWGKGGIKEPVKDEEAVKQFELIVQELNEKDIEAFNLSESIRREKRKRLNDRKAVSDLQFSPGDHVLWSKFDTTKKKDKLRLTWTGPYIVREVIASNVYIIADIFGELKESHAVRLKYYDGSNFKITEDIKSAYIHNKGPYYVKEVRKIKKNSEGVKVLIWWLGFDKTSSTWEPFNVMKEDIPEMLEAFLKKECDKGSELADDLLSKHFVANMIIKEYPKEISTSENYTQRHLSRSKGWSDKEKQVLDACVRTFGFGRWKKILDKKYLPGKTKTQIIAQAQRAIGRQRMAQFAGLKCSLDVIKSYNDKIKGYRKNGMLIERSKRSFDDLKRDWNQMKELLMPFETPIDEKQIPILDLEDIKGNDLRLSDKIDLMKNKLSEANMFQESLEKVNDLSGGLKFYIQFSGIWKRVVTLLDSGASITCGSLQNHNNMSNFIEIPDKKHGIIDANGNKSWIRGRIKTDIIVCGNGADSTLIIRGIEIYLVDNVKWTKILIGKGDLEKLQVSPSAQLISKMKENADATIEEINVVIGEANYDADILKKNEKRNPKAFNSLK